MKKLRKTLLLTSLLTSGIFTLALTNAANETSDLFGDLELSEDSLGPSSTGNNTSDTTGNNTTTTNKENKNNTTTTVNNNNENEEKGEGKTNDLQTLDYSFTSGGISFKVNYLKDKSNFIVEFTGNRTKDVVLSGISTQDLSGKTLDLGGLLSKMNIIVVANDIKQVSLDELKKKSITIPKDARVYLKGEFNDVDKQILATLLNNQDVFNVVFNEGENVKEMIPFKEGTLKNNATLEIEYLFKYEETKAKVVNDKVVNKVIKKKETGVVDISIIFLILVMLVSLITYYKLEKEDM